MTTDTVEMEQKMVAGTWWIFLLQGIAALVVGVLLLISPTKTVPILIAILGIYWIVGGLFNVIAALAGHVAEHKWWVVVAGVISIIAGLVVLDNTLWASVVIPTLAVIVLGIAALVNGVVTIFAGRRQEDGRERSWAGFFLGILYILFGTLLLAEPLLGAIAAVFVIAIWGIVGGIILIVLSLRVRKLAGK
jgi:uncharacterized membrane protein HdeD (DUF308 family)